MFLHYQPYCYHKNVEENIFNNRTIHPAIGDSG